MPDPTDWTVEAADLRKLKRELVTGQAISETRFGDDMVRFVKADLTRLDQMIREAEAKAEEQAGELRRPKRFAMGVRVRPY